MEQALRAVERLAEEQRQRLEELQRGHIQLEQALCAVRASKARSSADFEAGPSNPQLRRRTPPPSLPRAEDEAARTPRTEASSRTPRTEVSSRTPRSQRGELVDADTARMVRSSTDPNLAAKESAESIAYKRYRDDPRYRETGKQYGSWPPYPEWQDMPLRRFGMGFGKKGAKGDAGCGGPSHIKVGGDLEIEAKEWTQHGDRELVDGIARGIGHGRRKFSHMNMNTDHFDAGFVPLCGKDEWGRNIDLDDDIGRGKHHFFVKDHLNDESSTQVSSSRGSKASRRQSSYTEGSSRSSGSRSAR